MMSADHVIESLLADRPIGIAAAAAWAFVSLCSIARHLVLHRRDRVLSKVMWALVLLIPLFGWIVYVGFYQAPEASSWTGHAEHGRNADVASTANGH